MKKFLFILCVSLFFGCSNNEDVIAEFQPIELDFNSLGQGNLGSYDGIPQSNMVISNETDWNNLLVQMNSVSNNNIFDSFSSTNVDFNSKDVIVVILEVKPSLWYVEITEILENEDVINVTTSETITVLSAISQPFHIVEIEKTNKPVTFN